MFSNLVSSAWVCILIVFKMKRSLSESLGLTIQDGGDSGNKFVEMATRKDPTRDPEGSRVLEKSFLGVFRCGIGNPTLSQTKNALICYPISD